MNCLYPYSVSEYLDVPCCKCLACRINHAQEWSMRIMHELPYWDYATFLTLTYDDDHIPSDFSIHKKDLQLFFKRLRINLSRAGYDSNIRYFSAGEYGENSCRPHYHSIIFGLDNLNDNHKEIVMKSWNNCQWDKFQDELVFGTVTEDSSLYVASYVHKKYFGNYQKQIYQNNGLEPPFQLQSQGIGKLYALSQARRLRNDPYCYYKDKRIRAPRYYIKQVFPELHNYKWIGDDKAISNRLHLQELSKIKQEEYEFRLFERSKIMKVNPWILQHENAVQKNLDLKFFQKSRDFS